jgi:small ligand-binding sensory domain FIST
VANPLSRPTKKVQESSTMEEFNSDLVLHVVQFLNVIDSGRFAQASKRYYYLVHQYRLLSGPELAISSSWDPATERQLGSKEVVQNGISQLQKVPNLVLSFNSPRSSLSDELPKRINAETVIVGAIAGDIQVNHQNNVESKSNASIMCANFANSVLLPFCVECGPHCDEEIRTMKSKLQSKSDVGWKAIIVYSCGRGSGFVKSFVNEMQQILPEAAIVGGICASGYVSELEPDLEPMSKEDLHRLSTRQLKNLNRSLGGQDEVFLEKSELVDYVFQISRDRNNLIHCEDAVFGVVLGGDAPVRSMVSRGVESVLRESVQSSSPLIVSSAELSKPGDDSYLFRGPDLKPIHMIQRIQDMDTGKISPASGIIDQVVGTADFIGLKRPSQDGFELHLLSPYCQMAGQLLIMTDGSEEELASFDGAEIDFFALNGAACLSDMEKKVGKLKDQTQGEEILGAVMFSCSGRGPNSGGLIGERMADARSFANGFPNVPCLGFYAGGEIGPLALAGNENVFQTGRVAVQGFTAVFALFIVPVKESIYLYHLDDCQENVLEFLNSRLS